MKQRIKKIAIRILLFLFIFLTGSYYAFNSNYVQQKLTNYISNYLSNEWGTVVSVKKLNLEPFQQINIEDLYIQDLQGDTLLFAKNVYADFTKLKLLKKKYVLKEVRLDNLKLYLRRYKDRENLNLQFILDSFNPDTVKKSSSPLIIEFEELELKKVHFIYQDQNILDTSYGMHFQDLDIDHINGLFSNVKMINDSILFESYSFSAQDKSGLNLENLQTKGYISSTGMDLKPLYIKMNSSVVDANRLAFSYEQWGDYTNFVTKVKMEGDFRLARMFMNDIAFFASPLEGWQQEIILKGSINGTVSNLSGRSVKLQTGDITSFTGNFNFDGLPDIQNTFINFEAKQLITRGDDLEQFQTFPFKEHRYIKVPEGVKAIGNIKFKGDFTGFINDFVAFGSFKTDKGEIVSDVSLKMFENDTVVISGNFNTKKLQLATLLANEKFGILNSNLSVKIKIRDGDFESAALNGKIYQLGFNDYNYQNILLDGLLKENHFTGSINVDDPALQLDFTGKIEINDNIKDLDFKANLYYADLGALHFLPIQRYSSLSGSFNWNASGFDYTEMIGVFEINDLEYCTDEIAYDFGDIFLETDSAGSFKSIDLISSQLDVSINGDYKLSSIWDDLSWSVGKVMPALFPVDTSYFPSQQFTYNITLKDLSFFKALDIIDFDMEYGANIHGVFDPMNDHNSMSFYSENINVSGIDIQYPELFIDLTEKDIFIEIMADGLAFKESKTSLNNSTIIVNAQKDSVNMRIDWRQNEDRYGEGVLNAKVFSKLSYDISFDKLNFNILNKEWVLDNDAHIRIDTNYYRYTDFNLNSTDQGISFDGEISKEEMDTLKIQVKDFNLTNFNYILNQLDYSIAGISNGSIYWLEQENDFKLESNLQIDSAGINDYFLGDISLESSKNKTDTAYNFELRLLNDNFQNLGIEGRFNPNSKTEKKFDFDVKFDDFNLGFINHLKIPGISNVSGIGNGIVNFSGSFNNPVLDGSITIKKGGVTVEIIGSHLNFDTKVDFRKDFIGLDPFYITDSKGNKGLAYGTILHNHLKDWNFNLDIEMENLESLNLTKNIDAIYYGKAYATGTFNILGYDDQLFITVDAATKPNTDIYIPLGGSNSIEKQELVTFISYDSESVKLAELMEKSKAIKGVNMELNINVTPDAKVSLVFDEITGDILEVRANGLISMGLDNEGEFTMKGTLEATSGEYLFSMEGIINKRFIIESDSRITWFGDPYDANIDIKAVYNTRAALYPIMTFNQDAYRSRVNVGVELYLKNKLLSPLIEFGIKLPDSEEKERTALKNATISTQDLNLQVVSLLLFGSFQPLAGSSTNENFAAINSYEMLSNQVSNMLSQISENVDINFNYRPETSTSGQEIEVGFSTQFLNDRLSVSTDFGVRDNSYYGGDNTNNIVGDFSAEYKLTKDGRIRLKVFNKSNDYQSTAVLKQAPYTQGVGVIFRKEFDRSLKGKMTDWEQLQKKYDEKEEREKLKKEKQKEMPDE